ncbi:unnamed protein product [Eruca vesicaria subsp. sativa]|uniref:Uncharacterized protein n=1 Tax=Eruca vesicaria subsp. sativa TaxID=29727 RepID=A0ABC8L3W3_ERUVS|nr:unnamed protein product [Eruca vesicaria subsp. sativa]
MVEWTRAEKRTFLRQRVEARLAALLMENKEYVEALALLSGLVKEGRRLDDKLLLVDIDLLESIVLFAMLVSAFMISGFVITLLTHEPLVVKESLSFDYTKNSPEAYVAITRVNTPNHRTEISVLMTLPESEYNRNLGMFQVRVDFLSENGQVLATSRRPCMPRFRTEPIRLVQTFL